MLRSWAAADRGAGAGRARGRRLRARRPAARARGRRAQRRGAAGDRRAAPASTRRSRWRPRPTTATGSSSSPPSRSTTRRWSSEIVAIASDGEASAGPGPAELRVVAPARSSRLDRWASDLRPARGAAQRAVAVSLGSLAAAGLDAAGRVGDGDPVQAIEDELRGFAAREVVLVDGPGLGAGEVEEVRRRLDRPVAAASGDRFEQRGVVADRALPGEPLARLPNAAAQLREDARLAASLHRGGEPAHAGQMGADPRLRPPPRPAADEEAVLAVDGRPRSSAGCRW